MRNCKMKLTSGMQNSTHYYHRNNLSSSPKQCGILYDGNQS